MTVEIAIAKLQKYCAYQERCHREVRSKLLKLGVYGNDLEQVIADLVAEGFLNESRFAEAFARGKFRNNKWGKVKIRLELQRRTLSAYDITKALESISQDVYVQTLRNLMIRKFETTGEPDTFKRNQKVIRYVKQKGYEPALIFEVMSDLMLD